MTSFQAVILGIVEGLTEFLPVSSTGHLILARQLLGLGETEEARAAINTYLVVIQVGAILAVVAVYGSYLWQMFLGLLGKHAEGAKLLRNVSVAFLPAALVGLLMESWIDTYLFGLWPTSFAWLVGGVALVHWGHRSKDGPDTKGLELKDLTLRKALIIGCLQVVAMWPGTSRSLVTILGGRLVGLTLKDSVIFSFLLGMLTLGAATGYKLLGGGAEMVQMLGLPNLLLGVAVAGVSAWIAVKGMVAYLKKHGLEIFGYYRIALAVITVLLLLVGIIDADSGI
jgi:undecaprenyl-diphosphatase